MEAHRNLAIRLATFVVVGLFQLTEPGASDAEPPQWVGADGSTPSSRVATLDPVAVERVTGEVRIAVERLRGLEFSSDVNVRVVGNDAAREYLDRRLERFGQREQIDDAEQAFKLLGLIDEGVDLVALLMDAVQGQAAGFYDPETRSLFLVDSVPQSALRLLAAHELTHALEDQHFDLDRRLAAAIDDDDRLFALASVHEGSATLLMVAYGIESAVEGSLGADEMRALQEMEQESSAALAELPPIVARQLLGPYLLGVHFLTRGNPLAGAMGYPVADVGSAFSEGPQSSEQILHPAKYWDPNAHDQPLAVFLADAGKQLGRRWRLAGDGVLGEIGLGPLVGATMPLGGGGAAEAWTNEAAKGWGGDRWELWRRGDGEAAVVLLSTIWDDESEAVEFAAALPRRAGLQWRRDGACVAIVAGEAGRRTRRVLNKMLAAADCGLSGSPSAVRVSRQ